jgi:hypothetical protein
MFRPRSRPVAIWIAAESRARPGFLAGIDQEAKRVSIRVSIETGMLAFSSEAL